MVIAHTRNGLANVGLYPDFTYISLCTGGAGLDLGFRQAMPDARCILYVERDAACIGLLATHIETGALDSAPIWSDLRTLDCRRYRGRVHAVIGGIPCQPFSIAGKRRGKQDDRNLWPDALRIIEEIKPEYCFFENVPGMANRSVDWYVFRAIEPRLQEMGYRVESGFFSAAEVGAPHERKRLFIMADSGGRSTRHSGFDRDSRAIKAPSTMADAIRVDRSRRGVRETDNAMDVRRSRIDAAAGDAGRDMGDSDRERLQGRREALRQGTDELPAWPPGPKERDRWAAILARHPDLAPATQSPVRGVADGMAAGLARRDQLSILGNGVIPRCAAYAFRVLYGKLMGDGQ